MEKAHEAIISAEQFKNAQIMKARRQTGMLVCGQSLRKKYSRTKQVTSMVKDSKCKNKIWHAEVLEFIVDSRVHELFTSYKRTV